MVQIAQRCRSGRRTCRIDGPAGKGPGLPRPYADTVKGSRYSNMKELRIQCRGEPLRAFFAFDPYRIGIVLCAGNKAGNEKRFYDRMIQVADREFTNWLNTLNEKE